MSPSKYTFTVFTPTYNRAHLLHRVYESLEAQTFRDFEWLVVDDGSTDCTGDLIRQWQKLAGFPIHYVAKEHRGKYAAANLGAQIAQGELFLFIDSDDAALPHALERYKFHWDSIPADQKKQFSAVSAHVQDPEGNLVGSRFPFDPTDSDSLEIRYKYRVTGEKRGFHRTAVMRMFPYPCYEDETVVPDSWLWNQIARKYKTRYVNEVLMVYYQHPESLSANGFVARARNPKGARRYYLDLVSIDYPYPYPALIKGYANYVRFSLHAGVGPAVLLRQAPSSLTCLAAWPLGAALYLRDRRALKALEKTGNTPQ